METKNNEQQLYVQKEPFEYNGKMYNHYYIKGVVRGREVKIDLAPPNKDTDMGGYTVLDIVFGDADRADLIVEPFEIEDEKTKKVIKANRYIVRTVDEDPLYRPHGGRGRQSLRMHGKALAHVGQVAS